MQRKKRKKRGRGQTLFYSTVHLVYMVFYLFFFSFSPLFILFISFYSFFSPTLLSLHLCHLCASLLPPCHLLLPFHLFISSLFLSSLSTHLPPSPLYLLSYPLFCPFISSSIISPNPSSSSSFSFLSTSSSPHFPSSPCVFSCLSFPLLSSISISIVLFFLSQLLQLSYLLQFSPILLLISLFVPFAPLLPPQSLLLLICLLTFFLLLMSPFFFSVLPLTCTSPLLLCLISSPLLSLIPSPHSQTLTLVIPSQIRRSQSCDLSSQRQGGLAKES